jgi:hypothetical protein
MRHDKLGDMGHFVPMKKNVYYQRNCKWALFSKKCLFQLGNFKPTKPTTQN